MAFLFSLPEVHAQTGTADPDSLTIQATYAYSGVINTGDMLVVVEYDIDYVTLPTLAATDAYICRFFVDSTEVNNAEIVSFNDFGYGLGVCSMYFTDALRLASSIEFGNPNGEDYEVVVQGKPSAFSDPPQVTTLSITYRSASQTAKFLTSDIANLAQALENNSAWAANNFDLYAFATGQAFLTADGEAYFGLAIPNLQIMVPDLFGSSTISPDVSERDWDLSENNRLLTLWDNSPLAPVFDQQSAAWGISKPWILGLLGMSMVGGGIWFAQKRTGAPEFGMLTIPFAWPLAVAAGLGAMTAIMFVTAIAIMGLMFSLFLRRAS